MSERLTLAYGQVAREVEKLVTLFQESQENQQLFMSEAYRLLQEQSRDVEDLRNRAVTSEMIVQKLDQLMSMIQVIEVLLKQVHFTINLPKIGGGEKAEAAELPSTGMPTQPGAMQPGMMQPGMMQPGTSPSLLQGTSPSMMQGSTGPLQTPSTMHFEQAQTPGRPAWNHESQVFPSASMVGTESSYAASQPIADERAESLAFVSASVAAKESFADARSESESPAFASASVAVKESSYAPPSGSQPRPEVADPAPMHPNPEHPPMTTAQVRFIHASPDAPNVDILVDGKRVATGVGFQGVTPYLPMHPGRRRIQVFPAGVSHGAVVDTTVTLKPTQHYTVAVAGVLKNIRPIVIEDNPHHTKPGFARLKIVHLAQNAPAIDVTLPSGKVLIGHLTYKEKSPYLQVAPGTRDLDLRPAGKQEVVLKIPKIKFAPNLTYTLYVFQDGTRLVPLLLPEA